MTRLLPSSLAARLVIAAVALVAAVCVLIAVATTLAMHASLQSRLDADVQALASRAPAVAGPLLSPGGPQGAPDFDRSGPGTLVALIGADEGQGVVAGERKAGDEALPSSGLDALGDVPTDGAVHGVDVPGAGNYRVVAIEGRTASTGDPVTLVVGLPTEDVDDTLTNLIGWEALLTALGVAGAAGAGSLLVRRQLRPLREVAATAHAVALLPLASGDIGVTERVPERLTDERTEVGQVGQALNALLEHVEGSLAARHRSEQQVRQFVADASHELRTPLAVISGYTELVRRHPDDVTAGRAALAKVEEESTRMRGLVEDLLLLARLDAGRPLASEPVDLTRLLLEAVSDARVVAPEHRWVLHAGEEPVEVLGDGPRLHQAVSNLLTNARSHTPPGTTVTVTVRDDGFAVHDDGPGFPVGLDPFERFARGDESRTGGSSGLGLAIVKAIVEAHGGRIALASRQGDTTVDVRLGG